MKLRYPKLRELKEAVTVIFSRRFTTRFPAQPCVVPHSYRGKPQFDDDDCIGCGACVNVCPTEALTMQDDTEAQTPTRTITQRYDTCIYCGNCQDCCTTQRGIKLSNQWDLATLDRSSTIEEHKYELQMCEKCGAPVGTKKQLVWVGEKLGPLAYMNPSVVLAKKEALFAAAGSMARSSADVSEPAVSDFARILCAQCKRKLNIRL
jgi:hydrogenase-4 component H